MPDAPDHADEMVRLTVLQIRRSFDTQDETVAALNEVGFAPARIASLLGMTSNAANQSLNRTRKAQAQSAAAAKKKGKSK